VKGGGRSRRHRLAVALAGTALLACRHEAPAPPATSSHDAIQAADSLVVAALAAPYHARTWTQTLPPAGTLTRMLNAEEMMRAFARDDTAPVAFAGTVTQILARENGRVVVVEPDYHGAEPVADFELWALCSDSLATLAERQERMPRKEVAVVARVGRVERLVWSQDDYANGARTRYYVEAGCLALAPLPQP